MSGGTFDHQDWVINDIADQIEEMIESNDRTDGCGYCRGYKPETLAEFAIAVNLLRKAYVYVNRIDWLVAADDGEDTFHNRLAERLRKYEASK